MTRLHRAVAAASLALAIAPAAAHAAAQPRIVNGRTFDVPSYMGFVVSADTKITTAAACSGAAIRPNVLLTAAHCFMDFQHHTLFTRSAIVFGQNDPIHAVATDLSPNPVVRGVLPTGFRRRPNGVSVNDVALVQLRDPVPGVVPLIPAGHRRLVRAGTAAAVLGWGVTDGLESSGPAPLHRADLTVQTTRYCAQQWAYFDPSRMLCAWNATQSVCYGDSGSPLLVRGLGGGVVVAGVTDDGEQHCTPGVSGIFANLAGGPMSSFVRHQAARLQKLADAAKPAPVPTVPPAPPTVPATPATPTTPATPPPPQ